MNIIKNCQVILEEQLRFEAHNDVNFILKCEFCGRIYRGKYSEPTLRKHIITVHKGEQKFHSQFHKDLKFLRIRSKESKFLNKNTSNNINNKEVMNVVASSTCENTFQKQQKDDPKLQMKLRVQLQSLSDEEIKTHTSTSSSLVQAMEHFDDVDKTKKKITKKKKSTIYDYYSISPSHIISSLNTPNRSETLRQNAKLRIFQKKLNVENVVQGGQNKKKNCKKSNFKIGNKNKKFKCPHCQLQSITNANIRIHIKEVHEGKKDFTCGYCKKSFSRKFSLKKHEESVHTITESKNRFKLMNPKINITETLTMTLEEISQFALV